MKIVEELTTKQIEQLHKLYMQEWWSKNRNLEQTKEVVKNSSLIVAIIEDENLIAFLRVLSDYTIKTMIFDLIVKSEYRHKGLGVKLLEYIHNHKKLQNTTKELYCLPKMKNFYEKLGYKNLCDELLLMKL